jgi:hypothetical protein
VSTTPTSRRGPRPVRVLAPVVVAIFVAVASWWAADGVERNLTDRSRVALAGAGIHADVRYDGFDALITGTAADAREAAQAIGLVAGVPGTRHVVSRLIVSAAPAPEPSAGSPAGPADSAVPPLPAGRIAFALGSATLTARASSHLDQVVTYLDVHPGVHVEVRGHSDDTGRDEINWSLSKRRADAVVTYLVAHGVQPDRLRAVAFAATSPVAPNDTAAGRAANRRVELAIEEPS